MAPYHVRAVWCRPVTDSLGFVFGDARIDDAGDIIFFVLDFGQKAVIGFFFIVVFDVLDGHFLVALDNAHARFRFGFFFLGGFVFIFTGGGDDQRRFYDSRFFLVFGFILAVFRLVILVFVVGILGANHGGGHGGFRLAAAALLVERFRLERETAFGAFDGPLSKVIEARAATGAAPFCSKICLDQTACSHEEGVVGGARLPRVPPLVKGNKKAAMHPDSPRPLTARKAPPLKGIAQVPGDKSISQRALILGALAKGETRISGLLESGDVHSTAAALRRFGAELTRDAPGDWRVTGTGMGNWTSPMAPLDFGNSGTGSRLVMGAMATTPITATFTGDASLRSRPMARVMEPLLAFGVQFKGQGPKALMPLTLHGAANAKAAHVHVATASAQVKSALLLAALNASGASTITQAALTRDHTEKMLKAFGAKIDIANAPPAGEKITIWGPAELVACDILVPRDPSSAAFPLVAALITPGSEIEIPGVMLNPRRIGLMRILQKMGADIQIVNNRLSGGESIGNLIVRHSALKGVEVPASEAPSMIDEYPILAVAAAFASGKTVMRGLEELRVKESDRLAAIIAGLVANGVTAVAEGDDLTVTGMAQVPGGGTVATHMDHRIAMSFLTMGLASQKPVTVDDVAMIATSFPEYQDLMRGLGAVMETP